MAPPTIISLSLGSSCAVTEENVDAGGRSFRSSIESEESVDAMGHLPCGTMLIMDADVDGDQILAAADERNSIFRAQQPDVESAVADNNRNIKNGRSDKYPGIPAIESFETEECSEASTDAGEVARGEGGSFEDEEQGQSATASSSQLGVKDIILQRVHMVKEKLNDMLNWYTFVALSFLTAIAAILCVAFGNHGVAAILLFVAVLLITVLICWLRLDLRAVELM